MEPVSTDRTAALAEVNDPSTPAARLQELAHAHPELGPQILAHPNVYPALAQWIEEYATPAATPDTTAPDAAPAVAALPAPKWVLPTVLGVGALGTAAAVVAGIAIVPGLFAPSAEGAEPAPAEAGAAKVEPARDYLLGADVTWTALAMDPGEIGAEATWEFSAVTSDDIWVTLWPTGDFHVRRMIALDATTGATLWSRDAPRLDCAELALGGLAYCLDSESNETVVFDLATGEHAPSPLAGKPAAHVSVVGDTVALSRVAVAGSGYRIGATAYAPDGEVVWDHEAECAHYDTPSAEAAYAATWQPGSQLWLFGPCYLAWLDPETGTVLDSRTGTDAIWDGDGYLNAGSVLLNLEQGSLVAYDTLASELQWRVRIDGLTEFARMYATRHDHAAPLAILDFFSGEVTRVDAALAPTRVEGMPRELPDCPEGWTPVGWSEWSGGATLVCQAGDASVTVFLVQQGEARQSTSAVATPTGVRADIDGVEFEVALDGWLVWTDGRSQAAASGWTPARGEIRYAPAGEIESCPAGTFPLSLSVWRGGWLLTCGVTTYAPTRFVYEVDGTRGAGGALEWGRGRYCGTNDAGRLVCVSASPALVQFGTGSDLEQHSVAENHFAGVGAGGAGRGRGAYGVDAPADTPQDQVGYLVAILESSASARSKVNAVLAPLNACSVTDADIRALRELTQARTDLLTALATTPVDLVPNGATLLAQLTLALQLSEEADLGYVAAGVAMGDGDCAGGRAIYNNAIAVANQAEAAKHEFVATWNAQLPAEFGVRTFTARDI